MVLDTSATAASSVTRNGSCRKQKVVKSSVKKTMKIKTVSHLQTDIAKSCNQQRLSETIISGLKTALKKSVNTGFSVLFFEENITTYKIQDVIKLLHANWKDVLQRAHDCIPDENTHFSTCIVTPYCCNKNNQIHLYFSYSTLEYKPYVNKLSQVVKNLI